MLWGEDLPRHVYYGDGSEIEDSVMDHIGESYEKNAVRFKWREGDLVTLDNMITAHARDPFVGPRKIVVALGDLVQGADLDRASGRWFWRRGRVAEMGIEQECGTGHNWLLAFTATGVWSSPSHRLGREQSAWCRWKRAVSAG
jgi:hypothetical protein